MVKAVLLDQLWTRMNERGDFPLLSQSLRATVAAMSNDELDFSALVQVVLSDFALTQKVLRLANSAMYMAFGGNVTTVTRALMVLGMDAVGHLVVGLKIVDHFHASAPRRIDAKLELNRTMLSGCVARKLTEGGDMRAGEEAVVCTLMRQVGKLLVVFYLDAEWDQIRLRCERGASEDDACHAVLGVTYDDLGHEAATRWRLPDTIQSGMATYDPVADDGHPQQWLRAITNYSTEVAKVLSSPDITEDAREAGVFELARRYGSALATDPDQLARTSLSLAHEEAEGAVMREIVELRANADAIARSDAMPAEQKIANGIAELRALPPHSPFGAALTLASETVLASLGFARTIVFVRHGPNMFEAQLGFGPGVDDALSSLSFSAAFQPDVFHLAIANSVGIFIENAQDPKMVARQPAWFRSAFGDTRAFVLLPCALPQGAPIALLYGDWLMSQEPRRISQPEMSALNELARELARFFSPAATEAV